VLSIAKSKSILELKIIVNAGAFPSYSISGSLLQFSSSSFETFES
jgi:hypothetical protein